MSEHPVPQLRKELAQARYNRDDYARYVKLPLGSTYQGTKVTAGQRDAWQRALRQWQATVARLENAIRGYGERP